MSDDFSSHLMRLLVALPAFTAALTIHEFAHAWMGDRLGDDTPRRMGRLTLDPLAHLDPLGSLMFIISQWLGFGVGWAKPVPFNPRNLSHPRRDAMLIALAGPASNLLQMPVWLLLLAGVRTLGGDPGAMLQGSGGFSWVNILSMVMAYGVIVNILLAVFNMIPLPPLDGHYVLEALGPPAITDLFNAIRPFSFLLLIVLVQMRVLDNVITPFLIMALRLVRAVGGPYALG